MEAELLLGRDRRTMGQPWWDPATRTITPDRPSPGMYALGWFTAQIARENRKRDKKWQPPP
eukprot:8703745-Prorocentrum_lima.AAC.1